MSMRCEIVSQDRQVFSGEADMVVIPGTNGQMGILPNHAPIISTLAMGRIIVKHEGTERIFTCTGGLVEVIPGSISVLASASEALDDINVGRAQKARDRAEKMLQDGISPESDRDEYLSIEQALKRAVLRIETVDRFAQKRSSQATNLSQEE